MNKTDGYGLLHSGAIALAEVEANGMRIDIDYLDQAILDTQTRISGLEEKLRGCEEYRLQRRRFGQNTNLSSRDQLATVLFGNMGFHSLTSTATGKPRLDEAALEQIDAPYAKGFLRLEKLRKLCSTYLLGIRREVEGEYLHAFFGLHLVRSYRGQSDSPNLQNIPIRDPVQGCVIRPAFIPRPGHVLVEIDYSSLEVMIACALSGDKRLTYDAIEGDMHRDMAAECYLLDKDEVSKSVRSAAKGGFVFAEFYGDWYKQVAVNLWNDVKRGGFTTKNGTPLYDHLSGKGIVKRGLCEVGADSVLGTFEHHIRGVEHRFWNQRFRVYHAKRAAWIVQYNSQGYIDPIFQPVDAVQVFEVLHQVL